MPRKMPFKLDSFTAFVRIIYSPKEMKVNKIKELLLFSTFEGKLHFNRNTNTELRVARCRLKKTHTKEIRTALYIEQEQQLSTYNGKCEH